MALVIEGGIQVGGNIAIDGQAVSLPNPVVLVDPGNSRCYSGSGVSNIPNGAQDVSPINAGPGYRAALQDGTSWTHQGEASYFSYVASSNQYIDTQYSNNYLLGNNSYTYAAWVRPADYNAGAIVGGDSSIFAFLPTGGYNDGPSLLAGNTYVGPNVTDTTTEFLTNTWYFVAVTYDEVGGFMRLWVNGVNTATSGSVAPYTNPEPLYWGTLEGELWYTGNMGLMIAFDTALNGAQMLVLYNSAATRYGLPIQTSSRIWTLPGSYTFTVPEGVSGISAVVVGAGGGGTQDSYSPPGGDSVIFRTNNIVSNVATTITGTGNQISVSTSAYPNIANVAMGTDWIVTGNDIAGAVPAFDLVTGVNTSDPGNTVITINNTITTTAGDQFTFLQAIAAAEGGYEINDSVYNGPAAQILVGDGGGAGGVVDDSQEWPIGGAGAGGYAGQGGMGTTWDDNTATAGAGGGGGGGGGIFENSGAGGGGVGLYGQGASGDPGLFNIYDLEYDAYFGTGGAGGSNYADVAGVSGGVGGGATPWNGGRGGLPGGGGGSATDYYVGGNGGALAYRNSYEVGAGEEFGVIVGAGGQGQNNGGSGSPGAVRIVWPSNTRSFPTTNVGPDTASLPTLSITAHTFPGYGTSGSITYNISNTGNDTIVETGVIYGTTATYTASTDVCSGSNIIAERKVIRAADSCSNAPTTGLSGSQTINFDASTFAGDTIDVRAFALNSAGVAYSSNTLTWSVVICLAEGTMITLADNTTKAIEDITMSDRLKVWDFDNSKFDSALPLWIKHKQSTTQYNLLTFSDGTQLKTINQHRIFNKQAGAFTYPMTDDTPIGTITVDDIGNEITLTDKRVVFDQVNYYNIITDYHMNCYAEGILTSLRFNNIYNIASMKFVKDSRELRDLSEFEGIDSRWITGLRLREQTQDIGMIRKYVDRLEHNEFKVIAQQTPHWLIK